MKHLFVPKHIAELAEQKGFNEECLAKYLNNGALFMLNQSHEKWEKYAQKTVPAPLYQQLVEWLVEKECIIIELSYDFIAYDIKIIDSDCKEHIFESIFESKIIYGTLRESYNKAFEEAFKLIPKNETNNL